MFKASRCSQDYELSPQSKDRGFEFLLGSNKVILFLFTVTLLFFFPIILKPQVLLERHNDLQEFFWPIFFYTKQQLLLNQELPLWNNMFLSGVPLLPDPQSFLFYLPNIIFLIFPMGIAFTISFILHVFIGSIGTYLCAKYGFKLSNLASFFSASLFIISPKVAGYLEAGHYGLVTSFAFLPFLLLAVILLFQKQKFIYSILLAISLAGIFYTHTIIFILSFLITVIIFITYIIFIIPKQKWIKSTLLFCSAILLSFGLVAITFLPQVEWTPETTRFLLLENRDVYPKWISKKEFLENIFIPWSHGKEKLWEIDSEKWLSLGLFATSVALIGFWQLKKKLKIILAALVFAAVIIALNNASPLYLSLLNFDWYVLIRVATRVWFVIVFMVIFLAGYGLQYLVKTKVDKKIIICIVIIAIIELLLTSWIRLLKPIPNQAKFIPGGGYQYLKNNNGKFRVFCPNRCIPQQKAAEEGLELVEGYNTLLPTNYYKHMWQLAGSYWNYYTLSLPPIGSYTFERLQPNAKSLGEYNTKYVISPYELNDPDFKLEKKSDNFFIYKNSAFLPRAYFKTDVNHKDIEAPLLIYRPNHIRVDTSKQQSKQLILAEVYSQGWQAYLNGKEKTPVLETPNSLRLINISPNTMFVDFKYEPQSFQIGRIITLLTLLFITIHLGKKYIL